MVFIYSSFLNSSLFSWSEFPVVNSGKWWKLPAWSKRCQIQCTFLDNRQNGSILLGIGVFQLCKRVCAWLRMWLFHIWNKGSPTKETHQFKPVKLARILLRLSLGKAEGLEHVRPVWICVCREVTNMFIQFDSLSKELSPGKCSCRELCSAGLDLLEVHHTTRALSKRLGNTLRKKWNVKYCHDPCFGNFL